MISLIRNKEKKTLRLKAIACKITKSVWSGMFVSHSSSGEHLCVWDWLQFPSWSKCFHHSSKFCLISPKSKFLDGIYHDLLQNSLKWSNSVLWAQASWDFSHNYDIWYLTLCNLFEDNFLVINLEIFWFWELINARRLVWGG